MIENHQSRPDNPFWAALFLSVLFHLALLLYLKLPERAEPIRGKKTLSVVLAKPQEIAQPAAQPPLPVIPVTQESVVVPLSSPSELPKKHEPATPPVDALKPMPELNTKSTPDEVLQETPSDPVELSPQNIEAGKIEALLLVDESGKVQQIIWQVLPAISEEALQHMEQHLRIKAYLATGKSYTVYEIVEMPRE